MRLTLLIDGIDQTALLREEEWRLNRSAFGDIDTVSFVLEDTDLSADVVNGVECIIHTFGDSSDRHFGGIVEEVVTVPRGLGREIHISASSWEVLFSRSSVTKTFTNKNDSDIIIDSLADAGITEITTTSVKTGRSIDYLKFVGTSMLGVMQAVSEITGFVWYIDPNKNLVYEEQGISGNSFEFSDAPDNSTTFPYFDDIARRETLENFNAIEVRGGKDLSDDVTDTYSGDGSRKIWILGNDDVETHNPISREPTRAAIDAIDSSLPDRIVVEKNTGTDGTPVWTVQDVGLQGDTGKDVTWIPSQRRIEWASAPPNFATNSWRVHGRYWFDIVVINEEEESIARLGRIFKKSVIEPEIQTIEEAEDLAIAFMRDNKNSDQLEVRFWKDGLGVGRHVYFTSTKLGLTRKRYLVDRLSMRILGGSNIEYTATLGTLPTFATLMARIRNRANARDIIDEAAVTAIRMVQAGIDLKVTVTTQAMGDANGKYYCEDSDAATDRNKVFNPAFYANITDDWSQSDSGNHTITQEWDDSKDFIAGDVFPYVFPIDFRETKGRGALHQIMSASSAAGISYSALDPVTQIAVSAATVYAVQAKVISPLIGGTARFRLRVRWLDAAQALISSDEILHNTIGGDPVTLSNTFTSPALSAYAEIRLEIESQASGDYAEGWWTDVMFDESATVDSYIDGFQSPVSFWQGTANRSDSVKAGRTIMADFWKAS